MRPRIGSLHTQNCCGPFWELEKWSNCVTLGKIWNLLQKKINFLSFFDVFSICCRFCVCFFRLFFFPFLFSIFVGFLVFEPNLINQIQKLQKPPVFFVVFLVFFVCFFDVFSFCFDFFRFSRFFFGFFSNRKDIFDLFSNIRKN